VSGKATKTLSRRAGSPTRLDYFLYKPVRLHVQYKKRTFYFLHPYRESKKQKPEAEDPNEAFNTDGNYAAG